MAIAESHFTSMAGEHLVAFSIAMRSGVPVLARQGVRGFDLMAATVDGTHAVGIIVKTAVQARREIPGGPVLDFPFSLRAVQRISAKSLVCFVDLRGGGAGIVPDVYVLPLAVARDGVGAYPVAKYTQSRFTRPAVELEEFRNNWAPVEARLGWRIDANAPALPAASSEAAPTMGRMHLTPEYAGVNS